MTIWVNINRATGDILRKKEQAADMERVFNKPKVWIEQVIETAPAYNEDTHKIVRKTTQPDLSDLSIDVPPDTQRVEGWDTVALTTQEKRHRKLTQVALLDHTMARLTEDLMVAIAEGKPLIKASFPSDNWEKINARRKLRGDPDV